MLLYLHITLFCISASASSDSEYSSRLKKTLGDFQQLSKRVILEIVLIGETASKLGICIEHNIHFFGITSKYNFN
jgi:hypothetical protein